MTRFLVPDHLRSTYVSWRCMRKRCSAPSSKRYAGAGIRVCERWQQSFWDFVADVGPRPSRGHTLDRYPNNAGNYEPGNVRWATSKEQNNNRRPRRARVTLPYQGREVDARELSALTGLKLDSVHRRMSRGMSAAQIVNTPPRVWPCGRYGRSAGDNR